MLWDLFNPEKRTASREFDVAVHYLLHDAEKLVPLLKVLYRDKRPGYIEDILNGARPYEEAAAVIGIFLQQFFRKQDAATRHAVIAAVAENNFANPPNLLRIIGQVGYLLYLAEKDGHVRENLWTVWLNDMSKMLAETGEFTSDHCITYLVTLLNSYRDAKLKALRGP